MISIRPYHYEHDRGIILLSFVPVGEYFQLVTGPYEKPPNCPAGFFRKICFQTKYGEFNCMDVHSGEVFSLRDEVRCIRMHVKGDVLELEEGRFDREIDKNK